MLQKYDFQLVKKIRFILFFTVMLLLNISCKVRERIVEVEKEVKKTEYRDRILRDSIYQHDSVYVLQRGNTLTMYKYAYKYLNKFIRDTIRITDSIYIERPVQVEHIKVIYKTTKWQAWRLKFLNMLVLIALGYIVFKLRKPIWQIIRKILRLS